MSLSYGRIAAAGLTWSFFLVAWSKLGSLIAQMGLGWLLAKDDFKLYALAIGIMSLVSALRENGLQRLLIQQGHRFDELAVPTRRIAILMHMIAAVLLIGLAIPAASYYGEPALTPLIWVMAASLPLTAIPTVYASKLAIDLQFGTLAKIQSVSAVLRPLAMLGLAAAGFGPYSFVLPLLIVAGYEWAALRRVAGKLPLSNRSTWGVVKEWFPQLRWIILAQPAISLSMQADYLIVGKLQPDALAAYFFGFQLAVSFVVLFGQSVKNVMLPVLRRLSSERERCAVAFARVVQTLVLLAGPIGIGMALVSEPVINWIWDGKWDAAVPVVQAMALCMPFMVLGPLGITTMEALGRWHLVTITMYGFVMLLIAAASAGALLGGPGLIALLVGIQYIGRGLTLSMIAGRGLGLRGLDLAKQCVTGFFCSLLAGGIAIGASWWSPHSQIPWIDVGIRAMFYILAILVLWATLFRADVRILLRILRPNNTFAK
ncbi:MAG: oligosaccharide flippase family protein [Candidatus Competibacteraceae bacterium]|nr:oligosaccharide flippase family protein [Candidatus Competibacteraceae bacterium]